MTRPSARSPSSAPYTSGTRNPPPPRIVSLTPTPPAAASTPTLQAPPVVHRQPAARQTPQRGAGTARPPACEPPENGRGGVGSSARRRFAARRIGGRPRRGRCRGPLGRPARVRDAASPSGTHGSFPRHSEARQAQDTVAAHLRLAPRFPVVVVARPGTDAVTARPYPGAGAAGRHDACTAGRRRGDRRSDLPARPTARRPSALRGSARARARGGRAGSRVTGTAARLVDFRETLRERSPWAALPCWPSSSLAAVRVHRLGAAAAVHRRRPRCSASRRPGRGGRGCSRTVHLGRPLGAEGLGALMPHRAAAPSSRSCSVLPWTTSMFSLARTRKRGGAPATTGRPW